MRKGSGKGKVFSILSVVLMCCAFWMATSAQAQTKVVVVPLTGGNNLAPVPKTGQTTSYATRDDGALKKGVSAPSPRFIDNNNGTVEDRFTGLTWLKEGNCIQFFDGDATGVNSRNWDNAIIAANSLRSGYCGLTDGSAAGDWRLPTRKELDSLIDLGRYNPALPPDCPLAATTVASYYWSATTYASNPDYAWYVYFHYGYDYSNNKSSSLYVRAVRGGQ